MKIIIALPLDRTQLGSLSVCADDGSVLAGPFQIDGKADNAAAAAAGNPTRDPEKPFGDTPLGEYVGQLGHEPNNPANIRSFGAPDSTGNIPIIRLQPVELDPPSQAWKRQLNEGIGVDMGLAIHSGALNTNGTLRVTHGCVRIKPADRPLILVQLPKNSSFQVSITGGPNIDAVKEIS